MVAVVGLEPTDDMHFECIAYANSATQPCKNIHEEIRTLIYLTLNQALLPIEPHGQKLVVPLSNDLSESKTSVLQTELPP